MRWMLALLAMMHLVAQTYTVETSQGIQDISSEAYVAGVVAGESGVLHSDEALKAMSVTARTYAARMQGRHSKEGFDFCSTTHCQRFVKASARETKAAQETAGQLLWFDGKPAFTVYSRNCGGKTENVTAVWPDMAAPYLASHPDPYCSGNWTWSASPGQIQQALLKSSLKVPDHFQTITVVHRTNSGRAQMLSLDGELLTASTFRFAIGRFIAWNMVRSEKYSIENTGGRILFRGAGEGHGVGLCQMGADQMGLRGRSYPQILEFYYPGTTIGSHAGDFRWSQLSGEGVVLHTMLPDSDRIVLGIVESAIRNWRKRLPWSGPPVIQIYVYPDLDSFRNATGEPGWIAARTTGNRIDLQPIAVLRSRNALQGTLEHEVIHCFVESAARPGLPVWFREGLVEHLGGHLLPGGNSHVDDTDLRQRTDRKAAEAGYAEAAARVEQLIERYGETTVLTWVERGVPAEVRNSNASHPTVNNR